MATIDSLDIQISTSVQKASQAIDILVGKLGNLANALKIDTSKLENIGKIISLGEVSEQVKTVSENIGNMGAKVSQSMKPIQEQAKKAAKNLSQITEQYKDLGKGFTFSGDTSSLKKQIDSYSNALEKAKLKKQELEASGKTEGQMYEYAVRDVLKYENVLESLKSQLSSVEVPHIDLSALNQEELNNWFNNLPTVAQQAAQSITSSLGQIEIPKIEGIDTESLNYNANAMKAVFGEAASEIQNYTEAITRFGEQAGAVLNQPIKTDLSQMSTKELDEWFNNLPSIKAEVEKAAQDINNTLNQIQQPRSINISTESLNYNADAMKAVFGEAAEGIRNFQDAVQTLGSQAGKTLNESMSRMQEFGERLKNLEIPPIREENLKKLQSSLEKTESKLDELRANLANGLEMGRITESVDDKNYVKLQEQIALTEKQAEALRAKIQEVEQQSKTNWAQSLSNALGKVASFAKQAHTSLSRISSVLKRLNTGLNKAVGKFMSLGKSLSHVSKSSKKSELSLSKAFKMILRYGLGIRSVYVLINKLRRAIIDGFKNLAQYDDRTNASISMLKSSLTQLKNSMAAMLAPILNAIAPALNYLIQLFIRATNVVNQFFSALFGGSHWIRAKEVVEDYADSIKKAGKEAKNGIRQFDELNLITSESGSGGGGTNPSDMFETEPIDNGISKAAEKVRSILKDLFKPFKDAWNSEGKSVMDAWKYALDEVWKLVKDIGRDFLKVWQEPATLDILKDILAIIADIGLVIGNLARQFRLAWNENNVGLKIFRNIRDIIGIIIGHIKNAADATVEWSANLDFYPLLDAFNRFLESFKPAVDALSGILEDFYTKVLLPLGKWTIEEGLPKLLDVFTAFNDKVDWKALRENLSEFWEHLEPFAETVGEGLIIFIERVSDAIANFLNSETFVNFLHSIEEWMDNVTPEDAANGIEKLVKALLAFKVAVIGVNALKGVSVIINALKGVSVIINAISTAIGKLISIGSALFTFGRNIVGVFELMSNAGMTLHSAMTTIFGGLGTTLAGVFSVVSGIVLAVKNFVTMLTDGFSWLNEILMVVGTALAAIGAVILGAPALVAGIVAAVVAAVGTIVVVIHDNWDAICEWFSGVADWINTNVIQPVIGFFQGVWTSVSGFFTNLWNDITGIWSTASGWFNSSVIEPIVSFFQGLSLRVQQIFEGLWIIIQAVWIIVSQWFNENVIIPVVGFFQGLWENVSGFFVSLWEDIVAIWTTVSEWFDMNVITPVTDFFRQLWEDVSGFFSDLWDSIVDIWIGAANWFDSTVIQPLLGFFNTLWNGIRQGVVDAMNAAIGAIESGINFIVNGINSVLSGFNSLVSAAASLVGTSWGGVSLVSTVSLPRLATGGIVYEATFAEIGEAGKEGILPLTNRAAMSQLVNEIMTSAGGGQYGNGYDDGYSEELSLLMSQNQLLREQNRLLQAILDKPTMDTDSVYRAVTNKAAEHANYSRGKRLVIANEVF